MTATQATVEVFWTAFKTLPKSAKEDFVARLASDRDIREDLLDLAVIDKRRREKARPFAEYLANRVAKK